MSTRPLLPPIEREPAQMALIRIACRLVELDYRRHPDLYASYPPLRISALAEMQRQGGVAKGLYGTLIYISKAVACGHKLQALPYHTPDLVWRAIHKRRVGFRRS